MKNLTIWNVQIHNDKMVADTQKMTLLQMKYKMLVLEYFI